jgi:uncharacterized BrkB/YihY/UPF0761 family membrane protein
VIADTARRGYAYYRQASVRMDEVGVRLYAAAIAYRTIFSLVAFSSTLVLLALVLDVDVGSSGVSTALEPLPEDVATITVDRVERTLELGDDTVVVAGVVGIALGIAGLSSGFAAICDVLDRVHGVQRYTGFTSRYVRGAAVAAVFAALAVVAGALLVAGTRLGEAVLDALGLPAPGGVVTGTLLVAAASLTVALALGFVLRWGSHARPPWPEVSVGAVLGGAASVLLFFGFALAIALFQPFAAYGALASAVTLLVYGYAQAYVLIVTALFAPVAASCTRSLAAFVGRRWWHTERRAPESRRH